MATIQEKEEIQTRIDENGDEQTTIKRTTSKIERSSEPDYIKLYTKMWCEFNQIPNVYRPLFFELISNMTYCCTADLKNSQLVNTGKPWSDIIMQHLGWGRAMYQRGLSELCKCGAIKKVARGVYQINPQYAGRGEWKYNPRLNRGGIEDLVATFNFKEQTVDTKIIWADDGEDSQLNEIYRQGLGVEKEENTVLLSKDITEKVS